VSWIFEVGGGVEEAKFGFQGLCQLAEARDVSTSLLLTFLPSLAVLAFPRMECGYYFLPTIAKSPGSDKFMVGFLQEPLCVPRPYPRRPVFPPPSDTS